MKRTMIAMLLCAGMANMQAQWMETGNSSLDPDANFIGNTDAVPMNIRTEDIRRFRLNFDESYTIGSFGSQVKNGALLLSPDVDQFYTNGAPGPYSLLHLAAATDNAQVDSYRKWMDLGVSFTGNKDHGYIGNKFGASDYTDMIVHWSDNPGEFMKDRMRFIFTSGYDSGASSGAQSEEGLEFMRMWPNRYEDPHIGVGDFFAANPVAMNTKRFIHKAS